MATSVSWVPLSLSFGFEDYLGLGRPRFNFETSGLLTASFPWACHPLLDPGPQREDRKTQGCTHRPLFGTGSTRLHEWGLGLLRCMASSGISLSTEPGPVRPCPPCGLSSKSPGWVRKVPASCSVFFHVLV